MARNHHVVHLRCTNASLDQLTSLLQAQVLGVDCPQGEHEFNDRVQPARVLLYPKLLGLLAILLPSLPFVLVLLHPRCHDWRDYTWCSCVEEKKY